MPIALDGETFVAALVEMADAGCSVGYMVSLRVSKCYPTHIVGQIAVIARPKQQVPVVTHNAVTANPHIDPLQPFSKNHLKSREISIFAKNMQPTISPIENVVSVVA